MGEPFRLEPFQREFLNRLYAYDPATGERIVRRALLGLGKGNGKTELMAAIGLAELAGPVAPNSPNIPIAAASYEQANLLFGAARSMITEGPLAEYFEVYEDRILRRDAPGRMYRVAAEAGTNDGTRPTCFIADEVHEWVGRKERVHLVIGNSLAKRQQSLELNISTAGYDKDTLLGRLYDYGQKVASGEIVDPGFLFVWYEASPHWDLQDPDQLLGAIREANPAADKFWSADNLVRRYREIPENEWLRYHANRWTSSLDAWLPAGGWDDVESKTTVIPDGSEVVLGFDGSFNGDCTALVACTTTDKPHLTVVACWERPPNARDDWQVPILDVEQAIRDSCRKWSVREVVCDPFRWARSIQLLADEGLPMVEFPQTPTRMVPATSRFYEAVVNCEISHDGDPRLARHIANARLKTDARGPRLSKEHKSSKARIDLAVAAVMALDRATAHEAKKPTPRVVDLDSFLT